jgi:hypothetical protein
MKLKTRQKLTFLTALSILGALLLGSCESRPAFTPEALVQFAAEGDSVATLSQKALMQRLTSHIAADGFGGAVTYCSGNALPIMDSLSNGHGVEIRRISAKYRNPKDQPAEVDTPILHGMEARVQAGQLASDTVVVQDGQMVYYKPILLAMPTCLKCHGGEADLDSLASLRIHELFPTDKAVGYKLGDFRGAWRVRMQK